MNRRSRKIDSRYRHIVLFVVLLMIALAVRLFVLTVVLGPALWSSRIWWSKADREKVKDKYGRPTKDAEDAYVRLARKSLESYIVSREKIAVPADVPAEGPEWFRVRPLSSTKGATPWYFSGASSAWSKPQPFLVTTWMTTG